MTLYCNVRLTKEVKDVVSIFPLSCYDCDVSWSSQSVETPILNCWMCGKPGQSTHLYRPMNPGNYIAMEDYEQAP